MSMKNSNDTIAKRTRYLPACGAVPQPTVFICVGFTDFVPQVKRDELLMLHASTSSSTNLLWTHHVRTLIETSTFVTKYKEKLKLQMGSESV
jgi:hypothetical protein